MDELEETVTRWREQRAWLLLMLEDLESGDAFRGQWKGGLPADEIARVKAQCATLTTLLNYGDAILAELAKRARA